MVGQAVRGGKVSAATVATDAFGNVIGDYLARSSTSGGAAQKQGVDPTNPYGYQGSRSGITNLQADSALGTGASGPGSGDVGAWNAGSLPDLYDRIYGSGSRRTVGTAYAADNVQGPALSYPVVDHSSEIVVQQLPAVGDLPSPYGSQASMGPQQSLWNDLKGIANSNLSFGDQLSMGWGAVRYGFRNSDGAQGTAQMAGGALEVTGGIALGTGGGPLGVAVGSISIAHGVDNLVTGFDRAFGYGNNPTVTYQLVERATGSPTFASAVDQGIPFLTGVASVGQGLRLAENQVFSQTTYRGMTAQDAVSVEQGLGITAKNPNGIWSVEEHILNDGPGFGGARLNSPWISTTRDYSLADAYRRGLSGTDPGNGIVEIYLGKVPAQNQVEYWASASRSNMYGVSTAYHRSIWAEEVSVYQSIPQQAIGTPLSHVPVYRPVTWGLTLGGSGFTTNREGVR